MIIGALAAIRGLGQAEVAMPGCGPAALQVVGKRRPGLGAKSPGVDERPRRHPDRAGALQPLQGLVRHHALRQAIELSADDRVTGSGGEVTRLGGIRRRAVGSHHEARPHGDARRAEGQRRGKTPAVPETACGEDWHGHRVQRLGKQQQRRCRPGVPAAFAALADDHVCPKLDGLGRVPRSPTVGTQSTPAALTLSMNFDDGARP